MAEVEVGLALPNVGSGASLERCRQVAGMAVDLGLRSLWMTDHLLVGPDAADAYGSVIEPLTGLSVLAGELEDVSLGTSVLLVPLRHPVVVAKQTTVLQEATGGRFRLGVGVGWHQPEYDMLGVDFETRGGRADEALRLLRALWRGENRYVGGRWSFSQAAFGPVPHPPPEVWIGGNSAAAQRRAQELGDVWHPLLPEVDDVARFRADSKLPVRPRMVLSFDPDRAGAMALVDDPGRITDHLHRLRDAGADGFVISLDPPPHEEPTALEILIEQVAAQL